MEKETSINHKTANSDLGAVSSRYLSAEKAKQITLEAVKEIAAKECDTKCVLEQIEEAAQNGAYRLKRMMIIRFEIILFCLDMIALNLLSLGMIFI